MEFIAFDRNRLSLQVVTMVAKQGNLPHMMRMCGMARAWAGPVAARAWFATLLFTANAAGL
jgi:hypothetical protein